MNSVNDKEYIICRNCNLKYEKSKENTFCCNCFACTGCEIYYCPQCDEEVIIKPVKQAWQDSKNDSK